jgi:L-asparaginase
MRDSDIKLLVLTTGGTIASIASKSGYCPVSMEENFFEFYPLLIDFKVNIKIIEVFIKDSSNICPADWFIIAQTVKKNATNFDAVIILHGTDTLAWTSTALSYLLHDITFPVVLTGSMLPLDKAESDAADNIYAAVQFAIQLATSQRKGVAVAFADLLIHGPRITKLDSKHKKAFVSIDYPLLGTIIQGENGYKTALLTSNIPKLSGRRPWNYTSIFETDILVVPFYPGLNIKYFNTIIASNPKAIVLEVYSGERGIANIEEIYLKQIESAIKAGTLFVLRSQSPFGGIIIEEKMRSMGILSAYDMTREALITKLMLLLPIFSGEKLQKNLETNLCDEIRNFRS